ncbi:MAG: reverse transcriptase family protein, partial [Candidatus Thiodiazotropha endolucinida]
EVQSFSIHVDGVRKLLGLNPHKASGPDTIPTKFLKEAAFEIASALTLIFSASLSQGIVPDDWKTADVTPIFKKGDRSAPANYRPISLTAVCSKVMEHILHSQRILSDQQHGFRKRRSCESQLILTIQDLAQGLEEGEQIDAVLLDFSKTFDKVPHQRLLLKLHHFGIRGSLLSWIESFLTDRSQKVLVEGKASPSVPVVSGVPQGTVLGPLLFLLYINDLPEKVSSTVRLFADDSLLYRKIKSQEDHDILQEDLHLLEGWESDWQMLFNPSKCEVIRITKKRNRIPGSYCIHGQQLALAKSGKYLGVTITDTLSWNAHVDQAAKKANNSLAFLRRNLSSCPSQTKEPSYKSLVRPVLEYGSTVWDPHTQTNNSKLEAVQ